MNCKAICAVVLMLGMSLSAKAQQRDKSVYAELFGPSCLVGISYDARFKARSKWGYRAGFGYVGDSLLGTGSDSSSQYAVCAPLGVNYLAGGDRHNLELGLGADLGIHHKGINDSSNTSFVYCLYGNVGYRYTSKSGLQIRCGVNPSFDFGGKHGKSTSSPFYPYFSIGYAF